MPTPTEKRALAFFTGILLLGAGVRAVGAAGDPVAPPDARSRVELHRQIQAVDSARRSGGGRAGGRKSGGRRRAAPDTAGDADRQVGGSASSGSGRAQVYYLSPRSSRADRLGVDTAGASYASTQELPSGYSPAAKVDLDVASEVEIVRLPRIGPALAKRIVADRAVNGPFGSLEELTRVRGIGPGIARAIAPYVTFTLSPRPSPEGDGAPGASGGRVRRLRKPRTP